MNKKIKRVITKIERYLTKEEAKSIYNAILIDKDIKEENLKIHKLTNQAYMIEIKDIPTEKKNEIKDKVLVLDTISDPTNLGTLLRSAVAFGFDTVFLSNGSVDPYNDKVVRGSQGAIFKVNIIKGELLPFLSKLKKTHQILGTNVREGKDVCDTELRPKLALILGNEARGMCEEANKYTDSNLFIKMYNTESLNVSVAGSILMYEISKKR